MGFIGWLLKEHVVAQAMKPNFPTSLFYCWSSTHRMVCLYL